MLLTNLTTAPCSQIYSFLQESKLTKGAAVLFPMEEKLLGAECRVPGHRALRGMSPKVPPACAEHAAGNLHYLYPATDGRLSCRLPLQQSHLQPTLQIYPSHSTSGTSNQHQLQYRWTFSDFVLFAHTTLVHPRGQDINFLTKVDCNAIPPRLPGPKHNYR